jgi:oligopeptide/dipeptide ABC transporter ATP-binding protein
LLVLDEPTSALDVRAQARILELIGRLRGERSLAYLLITHNLAVVSELCEQIAVLYLGRVAESGPTAELLAAPAHPYTRALRSAVPEIAASARSTRIVLHGEPPDATNPPSGCVFHPRCPLAIERCVVEAPSLRAIAPGRLVACHRAEEVLAGIEMPERPGAVESGTVQSGAEPSNTAQSGAVASGAEASNAVQPGAAQPAPRAKG